MEKLCDELDAEELPTHEILRDLPRCSFDDIDWSQGQIVGYQATKSRVNAAAHAALHPGQVLTEWRVGDIVRGASGGLRCRGGRINSSALYEVVAVEPVKEMRDHAQTAHPHPNIRWMADSLPALSEVTAAGLTFDLIHLSAVFMHLPKPDRDRAFRKLTLLLKPCGRLHITLRDGPSEPERGLHEVPDAEMEALARAHGALIAFTHTAPDAMDRPEVSWRHVLFQLAQTS